RRDLHPRVRRQRQMCIRDSTNSITNTVTEKHLNSWIAILKTMESLSGNDRFKLKLKLKVTQNIYITKVLLKNENVFINKISIIDRVKLINSGLLVKLDYVFCFSVSFYKLYLKFRLK
ncbi:hypothetical protein C9J19_18620, partial [Photobacterium phosphoreum]|uniref:hypothetical protein n=1 Tax=Photobacterium phosphoreum TaxID=659 RepID=UPI000D4F3D30